MYCRDRRLRPQTVLEFLCDRFTYADRAAWSRMIQGGFVTVNGQFVAPDPPATAEFPHFRQIVEVGESREASGHSVASRRGPQSLATTAAISNIIFASSQLKQQDVIRFDPPRALEPEVDRSFRFLFIDDDVVVVCKSGNLPVAEGGRYEKNTLAYVLSEVLCSRKQRLHAQVGGEAAEVDGVRPTFRPDGDGGDQLAEPQRSLPGCHAPVRSTTTTSSNSSGLPSDCPREKLFPVHRLDKETSGITVLARHQVAARFLASQFLQHTLEAAATMTSSPSSVVGRTTNGRNHDDTNVKGFGCFAARKRYLAVVINPSSASVLPEGWACTVVARIGNVCADGEQPSGIKRSRDGTTPDDTAVAVNEAEEEEDEPTHHPPSRRAAPLDKIKMRCFPVRSHLGKPAISVISLIHSWPAMGLSLVEIELLTGRTHQARLHCACIGLPILGDKMYLEGGGCVTDDVYLARARGQLDVVYHPPVAATEERSGASRSAGLAAPISGDISVKRHLLHAATLEIELPSLSSPPSGGVPSRQRTNTSGHCSSRPPARRLLVVRSRVDALATFSRDVPQLAFCFDDNELRRTLLLA